MNMNEFLKKHPQYIEWDCVNGIWLSGTEGEGLREEWYASGKRRERSNYKNGKRHGLFEWWYYDGQLWNRSNWKDDRRTEQVEEWNEEGVKYNRHYEYSPLYRYETHSEMIGKILTIRLGCFTRTFDEWEKDFYNNDDEFPEGAEQTKAREQVYLAHCRFWNKKSFLEEEK